MYYDNRPGSSTENVAVTGNKYFAGPMGYNYPPTPPDTELQNLFHLYR